jgi:hypothetical protein
VTGCPSAGVFFRSVASLHVELPRVDVEPSSPAEHRRSTRSKKENSAPLRNSCVTQLSVRPPTNGKDHPLSDAIFSFVAQLPHPAGLWDHRGDSAMSAQCPVCPIADKAGRFMSTRSDLTTAKPISETTCANTCAVDEPLSRHLPFPDSYRRESGTQSRILVPY